MLYSAPSEIVNLGRVKAPIIGDRKRVRIALIRARLRRVWSSILGSFHAGRNSQFLTGRSIKHLFLVLFFAQSFLHADDFVELKTYEHSLYSQNGEDGILAKIFQLISSEHQILCRYRCRRWDYRQQHISSQAARMGLPLIGPLI